MSDPVAIHVGGRLRRLRLAKAMTLMDLQSAAGVSTAHISEIERGHTSPTIFTLERIATALGIDVAELLSPERDEPVAVVRGADRTTVAIADGVVMEPLSTGRRTTSLSAFHVRLAPRACARPRPGRHYGEEIVEMESGRLLVRSASDVIDLAGEDAVHILSEGALEFENPADDREAHAVWITAPALVW